ncbi:MAG TPA: sigma-54-dependent Fis family transcriptional regulator [Lacunisphaera sp.]|nr:sigma-54-dependent Fis family transcriptional regulator [Lacunisphaera sp.]
MQEDKSSRTARECELYRGLLRLNSRTEVEPFLKDALRLIVEVARAEQGYLELFQPGDTGQEEPWSIAAGCTNQEVAEIKALVSRGIIAETLNSGEITITASALLDPRFGQLGSVRSANIHAVLCAPVGKDPPLGVLYLQRRSVGDSFVAEDAACAEIFVTQLPALVHTLFDRQRFDERRDPTHRFRKALKIEHLVGSSVALARLLREVALVAPLDVSVLLTGENGCGKTQIARAIHDNGPRAQHPFVELNCAAIPEALMENELFGAAPGAHSTATQRTDGKVEAARGGTLLLDEVADLSTTAQAKLLQLLQTRRYYPLGSAQSVTADVRVIAATNVNLREAVANRKFREDLLYRLQVLPIRVPSLAERRQDIPALARHFCDLAQRTHRLRSLELSQGALLVLANSDWPGNVRELCHRVEAAAIRAAGDDSPHVEVVHLALDGQPSSPGAANATFHAATRAFQRKLLQDALDAAQGNVSEAARRLDLTRGHVYTLMKALGLQRE